LNSIGFPVGELKENVFVELQENGSSWTCGMICRSVESMSLEESTSSTLDRWKGLFALCLPMYF